MFLLSPILLFCFQAVLFCSHIYSRWQHSLFVLAYWKRWQGHREFFFRVVLVIFYIFYISLSVQLSFTLHFLTFSIGHYLPFLFSFCLKICHSSWSALDFSNFTWSENELVLNIHTKHDSMLNQVLFLFLFFWSMALSVVIDSSPFSDVPSPCFPQLLFIYMSSTSWFTTLFIFLLHTWQVQYHRVQTYTFNKFYWHTFLNVEDAVFYLISYFGI